MTTATHIPAKWMFAQGALTANQTVNLNDTVAGRFKIMAVKAGAGIPSTFNNGIQFVADITATNAEDTLIGARQSLTGIAWANDAAGNGINDWSWTNVVYAQAGGDDGLTRYFVIYYTGVGAADATFPVVAVLDPGQLISVVNGSLTISCPAGGLIQFTGGG